MGNGTRPVAERSGLRKRIRSVNSNWEFDVTLLALADLSEAEEWYSKEASALGARFVRSFEAQLERICRNPYKYPRVYLNLRRAVMPDFPYNVLFAAEDGWVTVVACVHQRRDPKDWQERAQP